jgi:hypothetical protein
MNNESMTNESDMEWNGLAGFTRTGCPAAAAAQLAAKPNLFPLVRTYLGQWAIVQFESNRKLLFPLLIFSKMGYLSIA